MKIKEAEENDIEQKADQIELEVLAENKKYNSFYQEQGFKERESEGIELKGEKAEQRILIKRLGG